MNEALEIYRRRAPSASVREASREARASTAREPWGSSAERGWSDPPSGPMTVDVAIRLAKANSPRLAELAAHTTVAEAGIEKAGQRSNPEIRATNVQAARAIDRGEDLRVVPRLRFTPERPGEIDAKEAEARAASRAAQAEEREEEDAIEAEIRWYFDDIVLLDAEIDAYQRMATTGRRLAIQARDQLANAMARGVDASVAELAAIEADARVAERRARRSLVAASLGERLGLGATNDLALVGDPTTWPPPSLPTEEMLVETALKRSPRVSGAAARIDETAARVDREKTQRWPWFKFVEVGYELERSTTNVPLWTVGAGIELPIFSANAGGIHQAQAARTDAKLHLVAEVDGIARDVRARARDANAAALLVSDFRKVALPALENAKAETAKALDSATIDTTRALLIEERQMRVEVELLRLVRHHRVAIDALRRTIGGPLPPAAGAGAPSERSSRVKGNR